MDPTGTDAQGPDLAESGGAAERVIGGVQWFGMNGDAAVAGPGADGPRPGRTPSTLVLGTAHGPRLLDLLRAAC